MRETNFCFPAQNRASVCISSQLYDRRALDTNSPLPLSNSLSHLVYLTSTSPRIREIMTMDGGLERLIRILHDFCISPPAPENPSILYGLLPPNYRPPKPQPVLNPRAVDKHAAYRFSLAFQSVVNIGVRGSEPIRSRVVQAGALEVIGCILEGWLVSKGFALGPSTSATGAPRETREQRAARRQQLADQRQQQQAAELARALEDEQQQQQELQLIQQRQQPADRSNRQTLTRISRRRQAEQTMDISTDSLSILPSAASPTNDTDPETSTDASTTQTPDGSNTPTGTVEVPGRDRSGTIIGRPVWNTNTATIRRAHRTRDRDTAISASTSRDTSRPETETEDDADVDMDRDVARASDASPEPILRPVQTSPMVRRAVGIVSDVAGPNANNTSLELSSDAHIIINQDQDLDGEGVGVQDGIVSLEANDDFAMGAPPGAPGAIEPARTIRPPDVPPTVRRVRGTDVTPRAGTANLPDSSEDTPMRPNAPLQRNLPLPTVGRGVPTADLNATMVRPVFSENRSHGHHRHHHHHEHDGPYRDDDVLLSLQLLAYLSKYPHVRQAFYAQRPSFHPAAEAAVKARQESSAAPSSAVPSSSKDASPSFIRSFTNRGKDKERAAPAEPASQRMTNVFSLVERFTFRTNVSESEMANPPPPMPSEIQYWAGVIMRNACRKDDSRGGIRQCANMLCGRWETYPREFAKCRRCRKAKYCGKECQSTAWSEGHRFWCSAKDGDDENEHGLPDEAGMSLRAQAVPSSGSATVRPERRDRDRVRERIMATTASAANSTEVARAAALQAYGQNSRSGTNAQPSAPDSGTSTGGNWERAVHGIAQRDVTASEVDFRTGVRRRAETVPMPGGIPTVVDPPVRPGAPEPQADRSRFFNIPPFAGPSRVGEGEGAFIIPIHAADASMYGNESEMMDLD